MSKWKKALVGLVALGMVLMPVSVSKADAVEGDEKPYISLGADLTKEQKNTVLSLLDVTEEELADYEVIQVTNEDEHD